MSTRAGKDSATLNYLATFVTQQQKHCNLGQNIWMNGLESKEKKSYQDLSLLMFGPPEPVGYMTYID